MISKVRRCLFYSLLFTDIFCFLTYWPKTSWHCLSFREIKKMELHLFSVSFPHDSFIPWSMAPQMGKHSLPVCVCVCVCVCVMPPLMHFRSQCGHLVSSAGGRLLVFTQKLYRRLSLSGYSSWKGKAASFYCEKSITWVAWGSTRPPSPGSLTTSQACPPCWSPTGNCSGSLPVHPARHWPPVQLGVRPSADVLWWLCSGRVY